MKRAISAGMLSLVLTFGGCASSVTGGGVVTGQSAPLITGAKVVIMPITDGVERKDGPAAGSGAAMTAALRDEFIQRSVAPLVTEATALDTAIIQARNLGYQYVLKGGFTEWEDNATEWSGKPDSAALSVELYDAETALLVSTATHREQGSSGALFSNAPDRFIPTIASKITSRIFRAPIAGKK